MKSTEFIKAVQGMAEIESQQETTRAIQATLETLAERLVGNEASQLAAQLPEELGQWLRGHESEPGESFPLKEFYQRVGDRAGTDAAQAAHYSRAVMSALNSAVTAGEFEDVKRNLPPDYSELLPPSKANSQT